MQGLGQRIGGEFSFMVAKEVVEFTVARNHELRIQLCEIRPLFCCREARIEHCGKKARSSCSNNGAEQFCRASQAKSDEVTCSKPETEESSSRTALKPLGNGRGQQLYLLCGGH